MAASIIEPAIPATATRTPLRIEVLSNRADLISGGDALVEIVTEDEDPEGLRVDVDGRDVTDAFGVRTGGRLLGLVDGLQPGDNVLTARLSRGRGARIAITNHPIGGPVFSGPQLQPWACDTEAAGLGPPIDDQCNAPTVHTHYYKNATSNLFEPYDPDDPPSDENIAETTTDEGHTVPYIVRVETGTTNRDVHSVAVLTDPSRPWEPWASQPGWNGKLLWIFGCNYSTDHRQGTQRACGRTDDTAVLNDMALRLGFMVAASTQTHLGNNINTTVHAETMMMLKEQIIETYGPIRYTIGQGNSGGAIAQHGIASQYPGLLDGLRPGQSFADAWSIATVNGFDCPLLDNYFASAPPTLWPDPAQRQAVYGYENNAALIDLDQGVAPCAQKAYRPEVWDPDGTACVPVEQRYDPETNPAGVRCSAQDYLVNIVGRRPQSAWGPIEERLGRGFANRFLDNVGVQYGLEALEDGTITPAQFVDLNVAIGGWDIDADWQPQRTEADLPALARMYRSGQLVQGQGLADAAIIDHRADSNNDVHSNRQSAIVRERLQVANGHVGNRAEWLEPAGSPRGDAINQVRATFLPMDRWLANIEADPSDDPRSVKVARNRPPDLADGCYLSGRPTDPAACSGYSLDDDPRLVAGMPNTRDILKCHLEPLDRADYAVTFTDEQWATLQSTFPQGVCDWTRPGVGQQPNLTWRTYADGPEGEPLGVPPTSVPLGRGPGDTSPPGN